MKKPSVKLLAIFSLCLHLSTNAANPVFSGPQKGEKITPFNVTPSGAIQPATRDPVAENKGSPITLVFIHGLERSIVPLLRAIDEYGHDRKDALKTELVFLAEDATSGEQRLKSAANSLKLKSSFGLSVDGLEGPGNYGLNKECMLTVLITTNGQVMENFALVQPGIADAPKIILAMAKASGDSNPPTAEALVSRSRPMGSRMADNTSTNDPAKTPFPGAVPTDEKLVALLRQFIRPTNENARVDQILADVKLHIQNNPDLRTQAIDGWTRILHFGDRYGTPHARQVGTNFLQELRKE